MIFSGIYLTSVVLLQAFGTNIFFFVVLLSFKLEMNGWSFFTPL
jgi:hypothetical protein